jgi:hypothetical protein
MLFHWRKFLSLKNSCLSWFWWILKERKDEMLHERHLVMQRETHSDLHDFYSDTVILFTHRFSSYIQWWSSDTDILLLFFFLFDRLDWESKRQVRNDMRETHERQVMLCLLGLLSFESIIESDPLFQWRNLRRKSRDMMMQFKRDASSSRRIILNSLPESYSKTACVILIPHDRVSGVPLAKRIIFIDWLCLFNNHHTMWIIERVNRSGLSVWSLSLVKQFISHRMCPLQVCLSPLESERNSCLSGFLVKTRAWLLWCKRQSLSPQWV